MTNQKLLDYAEEFSFSGIGHLLGFGLTSTMLAVAGAPTAALAALALKAFLFLVMAQHAAKSYMNSYLMMGKS